MITVNQLNLTWGKKNYFCIGFAQIHFPPGPNELIYVACIKTSLL